MNITAFDSMAAAIAVAGPPMYETPETPMCWWRYGRDYPSGAETIKALLECRATARGLDRAAQIRDAIETEIDSDWIAQTSRRRPVMAREGDEPCVGRYLSGNEEHWRRMNNRKTQQRVVRVAIVMAQDVESDHNDFELHCATAAAFAELAIRINCGVEIMAMSCAYIGPCEKQKQMNEIRGGELKGRKSTGYSLTDRSNPENWWAMALPVKSADDPLDLERILSIGIPGTQRWLANAVARSRLPHVDRFLCELPKKTDRSFFQTQMPLSLKEELDVDYVIGGGWRFSIIEALRQLAGLDGPQIDHNTIT